MGLALCGLAFLAALLLTWRAVTAGLAAVVTIGFVYGIVRANVLEAATHFLFDSAVFGFYLSYFSSHGLKAFREPRQQSLQRWVTLLVGMAILMFLVPMQHPFIQLVGLRGSILMLPFLLVGGRLSGEDADRLAIWLSLLNYVAFSFALAEYVLGIPAFFPKSPVTEIIYRSGDVAGGALRIPATFSNAASYGGAMLGTMPWLLGAWVQSRLVDWQKMFLVSGMGLGLIGMFMCASRSPLILLVPIVLVATFSRQLKGAAWLVWVVLIAGVLYVVSGEERMQRFTTLQDTDHVASRIEGSVNMGFFDLIVMYPFGNGMGAGGTSIPYFLEHLVREPVAMENEYSRILLEQGVAGLVLWMAFIAWLVGRWPTERRDPWLLGKRLLWVLSLCSFGQGMIGIGLMTAIPGALMLFLSIGFVVSPVPLAKRKKQVPPLTSADAAKAPVDSSAGLSPAPTRT